MAVHMRFLSKDLRILLVARVSRLMALQASKSPWVTKADTNGCLHTNWVVLQKKSTKFGGIHSFTISGSKPATWGRHLSSEDRALYSQYLSLFAYLVRICRDTQGPWPIAPSSMLGSWDGGWRRTAKFSNKV